MTSPELVSQEITGYSIIEKIQILISKSVFSKKFCYLLIDIKHIIYLSMTRTDISPNRTWLNGLCILKRQDTTLRKKTDEQWCKSDRYKRKTWFMPNSEHPWYSIDYIIPALNCKPKSENTALEKCSDTTRNGHPQTQISPVLPKAVLLFLLPLITTFWFKN